MKLCVSMWSYQELLNNGEMDFSGFVKECQANGVQYVELLDFFVEKQLDECLARLREAGITPAVWSVCNDFVQPGHAEKAGQIAYLRREIDIAARIGAPLMRVFSGDVKDSVPDYDAGLASIRECFAACLPHAEEKGVTLCLENHGVFAAESGQVLSLLSAAASPRFQSNFDTANFLFVDEDPLAAARNLAGRVALLHVKDYAPSATGVGWPTRMGKWYDGCALGHGCVPIPAILSALRQGGFDGVCSIELECPAPVAAARESVKLLRSLIS